MSKRYCPNCEKEFTEDDLEDGTAVYSEVNSDPYTGISYDEYYCAACVDEYKSDTNLLRRMFKGNLDKLDFKLRKRR